jgi:hypothetical protein
MMARRLWYAVEISLVFGRLLTADRRTTFISCSLVLGVGRMSFSQDPCTSLLPESHRAIRELDNVVSVTYLGVMFKSPMLLPTSFTQQGHLSTAWLHLCHWADDLFGLP